MDLSLQPDVGLSPAMQGGQGFMQAGEQAQELNSAEHPDGPSSSRYVKEKLRDFSSFIPLG